MSKVLGKSLLFSPAILTIILVFSPSAIATKPSASAEIASTPTASLEDTQSTSQVSAADLATELLAINPEQQAEATTKNQKDSGNQLKALDKAQNSNQVSITVRENTVAQAASETLTQAPYWAVKALRSLIEKYNCISPGEPGFDAIYLRRNIFATTLHNCLERIQESIAVVPQGFTESDLADLKRLEEEFASELAVLRDDNQLP